MDFHEQLPQGCPPTNAEEITAERDVFRLVASSPPTDWDFQSHTARWPQKRFPDECKARALSVSATRAHAELTSKLPKMKKGLLVCRVRLLSGAGMILQTGSEKEHYSWWRALHFAPLENCEIVG
jgi:hypothetical protein